MKRFTIKRVFIIFFSFVIGFAVYIGQNTQPSEMNERNIGDAVQVTSLPCSGKVVILDAGHGTPDERCRKQEWNYRSANQFSNCTKNTTTSRAVRLYGDFD